MSHIFTESAFDRLSKFLQKNAQISTIEQLTPDASTREYFRIKLDNKKAVACIYPDRFDENLPYLDVTNLFLSSGLPVAKILKIDFELGIVLHEDFGDRILRNVLENSVPEHREDLLNLAITLIAKIQKATPKAFELDSIASKLKFDKEKLLWELNFFKTHYFESLIKQMLSESDSGSLTKEFSELSSELEKYATVLTHRDFHAANLMLDDKNLLHIIDHQDARLGSVAYDLVSLLLDRITDLPTQIWLNEKKLYFLNEREKCGLEKIEFDKFNYEFELMTIQRCLKAIGTFSNQAGNFGKDHYIIYIDPMLTVVLNACQRLQRFPNLQRIIKNILSEKIT